MEAFDDIAGVRLGRKYAHGRRVRPVTAVEEAQSILARLDPSDVKTARTLLRRTLGSTSLRGVFVRPEEERIATVLAASGVLYLEEKVDGTAAVYHWHPYRVRIADGRRDEVRGVLGKLDPDEARGELAERIDGCAELADELGMLRAVPLGASLQVPTGSRAQTPAWSVYSAALRAAVGWYEARAAGRRLSERELAATSLGWSKAWTEARRDSFEKVIGKRFADAVDQMEPEVRLRGPLRWEAQGTIVDAAAARPWAAIPARSALTYGTLDHTGAHGVLVVENLDTFEAICRHSEVPGTWLCLWGHGYVNDSLVSLVKSIDKTTAAWSDLDAHGVAIVGDLQKRTQRPVTPVLMSAELHGESAYLSQDEAQRKLASDLSADGHVGLRALAGRIAETGVGREQETMHHLIPELMSALSRLIQER